MAAAQYAAAVLTDSPISYWKMNETSGTTAIDYGSALLNGTYASVGALPTLGVPGPIVGDTAVAFNAAIGQRVDRADNAAYDVGDTVTLEAWVKHPNAATVHGILTMAQGSAYIRVSASNTLVLLRSNVAVIVESTINVGNDTWTYVVATKTGATVKLYINAVDVTGAVTNSTLANPAFDLGIACDRNSLSPTEYLTGSIGHAAIYGTALSAARILAHYNAALAGDPSVVVPTARIRSRRTSW